MTKQSYQDVLRAKLSTLVIEHRAEMGDECFEELCALVNDECLRSFKNGLAAGRSRSDQPARRAVTIKGTALANGKLRPREQSLVEKA